MNIINRGIRNAFRNGIRAFGVIAILGLSIGLALSMLIARQAVDQKIESVKSSIGNTISVASAGVQGFEGGGEPLTEAQVATIKNTNHVVSVTATLSDRLTTENTDLESAIDAGSLGQRFGGQRGAPPAGGPEGSMATFTPPITVTGTNDATTLSSLGKVKLTDGKQINAQGATNEALIGADIAKKNTLKVGSTFTAYGSKVTVAGIIDSSGNRFAGNVVVLPLTTLQTLSNQVGSVTAALVTADSIDSADTVVASLKDSLGSAADVVSQQENTQTAIAPLESIKQLSLYGLIAAVITGGVIILLTMIMIVRERRREIGVMKAIGAKNNTVAIQFMAEAGTFTLIAAIIGIVFSILTAGPITTGLVNSASSDSTTTTMQGSGPPSPGGGPPNLGGGQARRSPGGVVANIQDVSTNINWSVVLYGLGAAFIIAFVGSAVSSWFITKIKPSEAIRSE